MNSEHTQARLVKSGVVAVSSSEAPRKANAILSNEILTNQ